MLSNHIGFINCYSENMRIFKNYLQATKASSREYHLEKNVQPESTVNDEL